MHRAICSHVHMIYLLYLCRTGCIYAVCLYWLYICRVPVLVVSMPCACTVHDHAVPQDPTKSAVFDDFAHMLRSSYQQDKGTEAMKPMTEEVSSDCDPVGPYVYGGAAMPWFSGPSHCAPPSTTLPYRYLHVSTLLHLTVTPRIGGSSLGKGKGCCRALWSHPWATVL